MRTRTIRGRSAGFILLLGTTSVWGGVIDTPTPTLNGHASQTVAIIPTVIKHIQQDTEVLCTNLGAASIDLGFEVFSPTGVLANDVSGPASATAVPGVLTGLVKGGTATFGTGGTVAMHEDTVITLDSAADTPANGSGRIVANVGAQVICTAYAIDTRHQFQTAPNSGVPTVRNPSLMPLEVTVPAGSGGTTTTTSTIVGTTSTSSTIGSTTTSTLPPPTCPPAPRAGCHQPFTSGKSKLTIKRPSDRTKQLFAWKWGAGTTTTSSDFGDPLHVTAYALCVYDAGSLVKTIAIPAAGACGKKFCWSATSKGINWKNKTGAALQQLTLKPGPNGSAQIQAKGKGASINPPALPFALPVRVQLDQNSSSTCWEATYSLPAKNLGNLFNSKAD